MAGSSAARQPVLVGNGQGFWGDSVLGPVRLVNEGPIHYLTLDYLAEVTMSILQKQKERDPSMGYARDFLGAIESVLPAVTDRGVRVVANAGGVNPESCARAVLAVAEQHAAKGKVTVGVVTGRWEDAELQDVRAWTEGQTCELAEAWQWIERAGLDWMDELREAQRGRVLELN